MLRSHKNSQCVAPSKRAPTSCAGLQFDAIVYSTWTLNPLMNHRGEVFCKHKQIVRSSALNAKSRGVQWTLTIEKNELPIVMQIDPKTPGLTVIKRTEKKRLAKMSRSRCWFYCCDDQFSFGNRWGNKTSRALIRFGLKFFFLLARLAFATVIASEFSVQIFAKTFFSMSNRSASARNGFCAWTAVSASLWWLLQMKKQ